jgi:excisionase family DNA binding protein
MEKFLDINKLAELLNVKPATIYSWIHEGYIPYYKINRLVRFKEKEIEAWLKEKRHKGRINRQIDVFDV